MKNILVSFNGHELSDSLLIPDTDLFDVSIEEQKNAKEAIEWILSNNGDDLNSFGPLSCTYGDIVDNMGYYLYNLIQDLFPQEKKFTVEHKVSVILTL